MMRMLTIALFTLLAALAQGQAPAKAGTRSETRHLVVTTSVADPAAARGARVALLIDVAPKAAMHVYSPEQKDYIPISLTLDPDPAYKSQPAVFPKAEKYFFKALEETQLVYSKPFQIVQPVTIAKSVKAGESITVKGTLKYQACDDAVCYRPEQVSVSWQLTVR